jgi:hypothetical protein
MSLIGIIFDPEKWTPDAITAAATAAIAVFTIVLVAVTNRQAKLTKEALIADKQAFVFAEGIFSNWEVGGQPGLYNWRFRPIWRNSGDTPTRNLVIQTNCELRNSPLPLGFNFSSSTPTGGGLLGPGATANGGMAPAMPGAAITPQDIKDVQNGTKFLYLWGSARYHDVFPKTPQHVTRFCWAIIVDGDPFAFTPGAIAPAPGSLRFENIHMAEGNSTDD